MSGNKLFDGWTYSLPLPTEFNGMMVKSTDKYSQYCLVNQKNATLHGPTLQAILAYLKLEQGITTEGAIGWQNEDKCISEYISHKNEIQTVVFNRSNGKFLAGIFDAVDHQSKPYVMDSKTGETGTALIFTLLPIAMEDEEFQKYYKQLSQCAANGFQHSPELDEAAYILCDNLYRRVGLANQLGKAGILTDIPKSGKITEFTMLNLSKGIYSPTHVEYGEFKILTLELSKQSVVIPKEEFIGKYSLQRQYSEKERKMIPTLKDTYLIPEEVPFICEHIAKTSGGPHPMNNIMLRGEAGTGKTSAALAIACGLGRPIVQPITCHADFEISDFLLQCIPCSMEEKKHMILPTLEDIQLDPPSAYQILTGEYLEDITETEVYEMLLQVIEEKARLNLANHEPRFKYQESSLVTAMRYGYVVEIQEPSVILKQGVLVGLNSLLDQCESVTLPNGEVIHRHPDTVVIITTNNDYEGCRNINQSILSRMDMIFDMDSLTKEQYVNRVASNTGCTEWTTIERMVETLMQIRERLKENMITDGSCGMRELISWVQSYMVCQDIVKAAKNTILSSLSNDYENRLDILNTCILPVFGS